MAKKKVVKPHIPPNRSKEWCLLNQIAAKFSGIAIDDLTIMETHVAELLKEQGFLWIEKRHSEKFFISEHVVKLRADQNRITLQEMKTRLETAPRA